MEFEVGETFIVTARVDEDDICYESDNFLIELYDFDVTLIGKSYVDVVITVPTSLDIIDNISHDPLDVSHVSSLCSLPSLFPECHIMSVVNYHNVLEENVDDCVEFLGTFRGYDPSFDPYSLYLRNVLAENMLTIAFDYSTDFSKVFDKFRRVLIIISRFIFTCSYLHPAELHAQVYDKLVRALTASELRACV